jgi:16S rRNA (cytosine967-C5)-methyltransferase
MSQRVAVDDARARRVAVDLYERAAADWARAPSLLARGLRGARELSSRQRRLVGEAVYGMIRWRRRLTFLVGSESAEALYTAWCEGELGQRDTAADQARLATIADPVQSLATAQSYPDWMVRLFADERGLDEAARLCAAMNRRAPLTVRANRLRNTRDELQARLAEELVASRPCALAPDGLELETHVNAYGLQAFKEGRFELQDASSQIAAELVAPPPRGLVLDACAGAGGKTLALGALLGNRGRLAALDVSERKLVELSKRARRAGLTNLEARTVDDFFARRASAPQFDRVLCDAPCSGLGVLRRNPEARWRLGPGDLDELPRLQRAILERYAPLVRGGGRLIYATCTVTALENDRVVDEFLAAHAEFAAVPAKEILGGERARAVGDGERLRLLPHVHDCDGFFAAVLRRK